MIRNLKIRKNILSIDWDKSDYDLFFRIGLQALADEYFQGERKVVVVPCDPLTGLSGVRAELDSALKKAKTIEVSDAFADACTEYGVNYALKEQFYKLKRLDEASKHCPRNLAKKKIKKTVAVKKTKPRN